MNADARCPKCNSCDVIFSLERKLYRCGNCDHAFQPQQQVPSRRIFLSYGHDQHAGLAERLKQDLEARGHWVWFDADRLKVGRDWEADIDRGLAEVAQDPAGGVVLLMTPHAVRRPGGYCLNEVARAISKRLPIIPVMVEWTEPPLSICRTQWLDMTDCVPWPKGQARYEAKLPRLLAAIELDRLDFEEGSQNRLLEALHPLSFEAELATKLDRFTGRQWLFKDIDRWLEDANAPPVLLITGAPGIGKTSIAAWLCNYREVAAFHLCQANNLEKREPRHCVLSLAYQLSSQLPEYQRRLLAMGDLGRINQERDAHSLFDRLIVQPLYKTPYPGRRFLVVIDALDEALEEGQNHLAQFLAEEFLHRRTTPDWLRLLVTSRPELPVVQSFQGCQEYVFRESDQKNRQDIQHYVDGELSRFAANGALPLDALGAIVARSEGIFLYVSCIYEELKYGRLSLDRLENFPQGLGGFYNRFFQRQYPRVEEYRTHFRPVLEVVAAAREPLPLDLMAALFNWDSYAAQEVLQSLGSLFPQRDDRLEPFHQTVVDWLTNQHRAGSYLVTPEPGHRRLADFGWRLFSQSPAQLPNYFLRYLPGHLIAIQRWDELRQVLCDPDLLARVMESGNKHRWMRYWQNLPQFPPGPAYETALASWIKPKNEGADVSRILDLVGCLLRDMGELSAALPFLQRALSMREQSLGAERPEFAASLHGLAELYRHERQYGQALPLYERALAIRLRTLPLNHPELATSLHDLAEFYHDQKNYAEARQFYQRALEMRERMGQAEDPGLGDCLNDLGALCYELDNEEEALALYQRALRIYERAYGSEHPDVAACLHNIAQVREKQGRPEEAQAMFQQALRILEETFPPHHPKVQHSRTSLAEFYERHRQFSKAVDLWEQIQKGGEKAHAPCSTAVLEALEKLAGLHESPEDAAGAVALRQRMLGIIMRVGTTNPEEAANALGRLAWLHLNRLDYTQAVSCAREALRLRESVNGAEHPVSANSLNTLVRCLQEQGEYSEALPLCRRALAIRERALAPDHPDIAVSLNNLGLTLVQLGELEEAEHTLLRAAQTDPRSPYPLYWLAQLYHRRQDPKDQGREMATWRRYLELGAPSLERRMEALARLAEQPEAPPW